MYATKLSFVIGTLLVLGGIFVPSPTLIDSLRATPEGLREQLLLGATLFKIGLVICGFLVITLGRLSIWKVETQNQNGRSDPNRKNIVALLVAILCAASLLRLYRLDSGLWLDEILTYVLYVKMPFGEIISTYVSENQHFIYSLLAHASFSMFGESAWALRLPAVLFGVASIWALFAFGCQVTNAREALLASALLAFSYHHIWFSQNARGYTGLLFWTIFASWLFLRGLGEPRPALWVLYATAAALGVYTHMTMLFVIMGHFIIYLMALYTRRTEVWSNRWAGFFLGFCLVGLLTLQLHALVLPQMVDGIGGTESVVNAWKQPLWTLFEIVKGMQIGFAGSLVAAAAFLLFGAGCVSFARTNPVVLQLLIFPAAICTTVVIGMGHHLWPRFFFFGIGFGALITVRGVMYLAELATKIIRLDMAKSVPIGTVLAAGVVLASAVSVPSVYGPKQDYQGALTFVQERQEPGDTVVAVGLATFPYRTFYKVDWEIAETVETLNNIRARAKRTWMVYTIRPHLQSVYPEIMESIRRDFTMVKRFHGTLRGGTIFVSRSDSLHSLVPTASVGI